jgi:hypothetical protein
MGLDRSWDQLGTWRFWLAEVNSLITRDTPMTAAAAEQHTRNTLSKCQPLQYHATVIGLSKPAGELQQAVQWLMVQACQHCSSQAAYPHIKTISCL